MLSGVCAAATPQTPHVAASIAALLPLPVGAAEICGGGDPATIMDEEWPALAAASPKRVAEFAAGRACARLALQQLGVGPHTPLPVGAQRAPSWPPGIAGSISHAQGACAAVAVPVGTCMAVGIDIECIDAVTPDVWPMLCTPREADWLQRLPRIWRTRAAALLFSAKEAYFKCQFPLFGDWLEFSEVEVRIDAHSLAGGRFTIARRIAAQRARVAALRCVGRYAFAAGLVRCGVVLLRK